MDESTEKFLSAVKKYKKILIAIVGSPDPDAIASSFAIMEILKIQKIDSAIVSQREVSLSQNRAFMKLLKIPMKVDSQFHCDGFDAYIVTDFQLNLIKNVSEKIPCAAHIDHHEPEKNRIPADFTLIRTDCGSTSALVTTFVKDLKDELNAKDLQLISTALMFGIQTDTDSCVHASETDLEAINFLSQFANSKIINKLNGIHFSETTMSYYDRALKNQTLYKDWCFYGIGFIDILHRDSIAVIADLLLRKNSHRLVAVYSIIYDEDMKEVYLDVSLRTKSKTLDLNSMIKKITPSGGGRTFKGAYQVNLNYFRFTDKNHLWSLVEEATIDWLKRSRDSSYLHEFSGIAKSFLNRIMDFLKK
ncbi:MAG TPA: DHH family phosphoesterase [Spirochaetota bacterium]|nr:DHH family phosphoesterase [Spirochaetota bacterium]